MSVNEDSNLNGLLSVYLKCEKDLSPYLKKKTYFKVSVFNLFLWNWLLLFTADFSAPEGIDSFFDTFRRSP